MQLFKWRCSINDLKHSEVELVTFRISKVLHTFLKTKGDKCDLSPFVNINIQLLFLNNNLFSNYTIVSMDQS